MDDTFLPASSQAAGPPFLKPLHMNCDLPGRGCGVQITEATLAVVWLVDSSCGNVDLWPGERETWF